MRCDKMHNVEWQLVCYLHTLLYDLEQRPPVLRHRFHLIHKFSSIKLNGGRGLVAVHIFSKRNHQWIHKGNILLQTMLNKLLMYLFSTLTMLTLSVSETSKDIISNKLNDNYMHVLCTYS